VNQSDARLYAPSPADYAAPSILPPAANRPGGRFIRSAARGGFDQPAGARYGYEVIVENPNLSPAAMRKCAPMSAMVLEQAGLALLPMLLLAPRPLAHVVQIKANAALVL
jgi:hypothetical protein